MRPSSPFPFIRALFRVLPIACALPLLADTGGPEPFRTHTVAPLHAVRPCATSLTMPAPVNSEWASASVDFTWGNVWVYGFEDYRFDGEWLRTSFRFERNSGRAAFSMEVPMIGRFGGALDSFIESFHDVTGTSGGQFRDQAPRNQVQVFVAGSNGTFRLDDSSWGLGDITLTVAWTLCAAEGNVPGVSAQLLATLPTGDEDELTGLGEPAYGAGLTAIERFGDSPLGLYLGVLYFGTRADTLAGAAIRQQSVSGVAGAELRLGTHWSVAAQYLGQTPVLEGFRELSQPMHEISLGLRKRWKGGSSVEVALIENAGSFGNSTDIALHAGWKTVF